MRFGWDEIKRRARAFSEEWKAAHYEKGETQSFYNDFFEIFGVRRRTVATYERRVESIDANRRGFIDLFWPGTLIVEQKSGGRDLLKAQGQAFEYFDWLPDKDKPRYILTCDFQRWRLLDLDTNTETAFTLPELHKHIEAFGFILGRQRSFETQASVTIKAAELMGRLHDALEASGYTGHDLEQLLVRLLFCLFADDTGIFQPSQIFLQLLDNDTRDDGSDTGRVLMELFDILDTPEDKRQTGLSDELNAFPYVNGQLFAGRLRTPVFDAKMRGYLIDACRHNWSGVSPAIFGSLFQSVMSADKRRRIGAHYTSEANIMKVIGPLFLDDLRAELDAIIGRKTGRQAALLEFQHKLTRLTFFDPACGCGNFLVVAYREIRRLELDCLKALYPDQQIEAALLSRITVDQFYGIEIEEFPARIAEVAMWMADHLANNELNEAFRTNYARIPLKDSAHIHHADALETDWSNVIAPEKCSYIMGNPPFVGHQWRSALQQAGMHSVWGSKGQFNRLDFVTAWFRKSTSLMKANPRIEAALVSTNSIVQGEQAGILWPTIFATGASIKFAHRTFVWSNEAAGQAAVHVVVIGLTMRPQPEVMLFDYPNPRGEPIAARVKRINGYLIEGPPVSIPARTAAPAGKPEMFKGSQPTDGARLRGEDGDYVTVSNLILDAAERSRFIERAPSAAKWLRPFVGGDELISGNWRWCLWLKDVSPSELRAEPEIVARLRRVKEGRLQSPTASVRQWADFPALFTQDRQPSTHYIAIPEVSSERREYLPIALLPPEVIASNKLQIIPTESLTVFGYLCSRMHMAWVKTVAGRLKSDFSYSPTVYNTFPWPDATPAQRAKIEQLAQAVLDARANHSSASLADLYDPDTMPADLRRAHHALDLAVDRLYRPAPFASDRDRVEHLFGRYEALVNPLATAGVKANKRVARKAALRD